MIEPQAQLEAGIAGLDVVLNIGGLLLDGVRLRVERAGEPPRVRSYGRRSGLKSGLVRRIELRIGEADA